MNLNTKSHVSLYYQLMQDLKQKISKGEWNSGHKIPNEFELCEMYNVSRITVRKALQELEKEGFFERWQGKGTFVSIPKIEQRLTSFYSLSEEFKKRGTPIVNEVSMFKKVRPVGEVPIKMTIDRQKYVYCFERLRYAENTLIAVEKTFIPADIFSGMNLKTLESNSLYDIMRKQYGVIPAAADESFGVIAMDEASAELFSVEKGSPAFEIERLTYCDNICIEYTKGIIRGDMFRFNVRLV